MGSADYKHYPGTMASSGNTMAVLLQRSDGRGREQDDYRLSLHTGIEPLQEIPTGAEAGRAGVEGEGGARRKEEERCQRGVPGADL